MDHETSIKRSTAVDRAVKAINDAGGSATGFIKDPAVYEFICAMGQNDIFLTHETPKKKNYITEINPCDDCIPELLNECLTCPVLHNNNA